MSDQNHLLELADELPEARSSQFPPNAFYGIDRILLGYAGLPMDFPVNAVVPHGVVFDRRSIWSAEASAKVPAVLCYPDYRMASYTAGTRLHVVPSASPHAYLCAALSGEGGDVGRSGTIFFVQHSTHHVMSDIDANGLAVELASVDGQWGPVTVCMYWRDIQLGRHRPFIAAGLRVVTAGHLFDPKFLHRLYWLCSSHRYTSGNVFGTHSFFAVLAGCIHIRLRGVRHNPECRVRELVSAEHHVARLDLEPDEIDQFDLSASLHAQDPDPAVQRSVAEEFLGVAHILSPEGLADLLHDLRRKDRWGTIVPREGGSHWLAPGWIRRLLSRDWIRGLQRLLNRRLVKRRGR